MNHTTRYCLHVWNNFYILFKVAQKIKNHNNNLSLKPYALNCIFSKFGSLEIRDRQLAWGDVINYLGIEFKVGNHLQADLSSRVRKFQSAVCTVLRYNLARRELVYIETILKKCMPIL